MHWLLFVIAALYLVIGAAGFVFGITCLKHLHRACQRERIRAERWQILVVAFSICAVWPLSISLFVSGFGASLKRDEVKLEDLVE